MRAVPTATKPVQGVCWQSVRNKVYDGSVLKDAKNARKEAIIGMVGETELSLAKDQTVVLSCPT